jgi:hypothetical protein
VGDARRLSHRPRCLRVADPALHRSRRGVRLRRDPAEVPEDATPFDMRGVELSHHHGDCSFETFLRRYELNDPILWRIAEGVHEADVDDERYEAPEAPGLDMVLRGLSLVRSDDELIDVAQVLFDGLYEYHRQAALLDREPS